MFDGNQDFYGIQANYLKDLCELRGNVPDKALHSNFKVFNSYVDAYIVCPIIGFLYSRRIPMGSSTDGDVGILYEQISKKKQELRFVYQILMLIDEDSEPDKEKRVFRAFRLSETAESDKEQIDENMKIYNEYFLGGIDVMHEQFVDQCTDDESYLKRIYDFVTQFNTEQDAEALKASIDQLLNK